MMNKFEVHYNNFLHRIDEICSFIDMVSLQKEFWSLIDKDYTELKQNSYFLSLYKQLNSTVQYNAVVISVYACFENFIDDILWAYVNSVMVNGNGIDGISPKAKEKYISSFTEYLSSPQRFVGLDITKDEAIRGLYEVCCTNSSNLVEKFLMKHSGNLKRKQVDELMRDLGIEKHLDSLVNHIFIDDYIEQIENEDLKNTLSKDRNYLLDILDNIVDKRNIISHSWSSDDRLAYGTLRVYVSLISLIAKIICDMIIEQYFYKLHKSEKLYDLGNAINVYDDHILCINSKESTFKIGDYFFYIKGNDEYGIAKIKNIQIDHQDVTEVSRIHKDIGILFDRKVKKGYSYYCVNTV